MIWYLMVKLSTYSLLLCVLYLLPVAQKQMLRMMVSVWRTAGQSHLLLLTAAHQVRLQQIKASRQNWKQREDTLQEMLLSLSLNSRSKS